MAMNKNKTQQAINLLENFSKKLKSVNKELRISDSEAKDIDKALFELLANNLQLSNDVIVAQQHLIQEMQKKQNVAGNDILQQPLKLNDDGELIIDAGGFRS